MFTCLRQSVGYLLLRLALASYLVSSGRLIEQDYVATLNTIKRTQRAGLTLYQWAYSCRLSRTARRE
ncbi:hypothetical protein OH492_18165 [Vibrio chagasii]|nr:hypothetical protein [Vibrio chagasii]